MKLELNCTPPSTNHVYRRRASYGLYMTQEGLDFKNQVSWLAKAKWGPTPSKKPMMMHVVLEFADKRRRDVDGFHKLLQDSLQGICYEDDSQIMSLSITKSSGHKTPRTLISVQEIN